MAGSGAAPGEPLPPNVQAELNRIPDVIREEGQPGQPGHSDVGQGSGGAPEATIGPGDIRGLMESVAFEEQDIRDLLEEAFEWLAERFHSDHWKLTDRQGRMLGKPTAVLANSMWQRLCVYLPEILGAWVQNTPGAAAFLMAAGIVIGPKVMQQARLNRAGRVIPAKPQAASKQPAAPPQSTAHIGGIPVATGKVE